MAYQSPLHILEGLDLAPESLQPSDIGRLRKKLMAEFTLSNEITIRIGGADYSKDEIIRKLDDLAGLRQLDVHIAIFRNKSILQFCENPAAADPEKIALLLKSFLENESTPALAKDVVGHAILEGLAGQLKQQQYKEAKDWHKLAKQYAPEMQDLLNQTVVRHLADTGEMLESVNSDNYPQPKILQSVAFLTNINWVLYLNYCMGDYQELIESFVAEVIDLTVRLQRTEKWFCYAVSDVSCQLNVNVELKSLIKANFEIYKGNYYKTSGTVKREGSFPWGWTIWILLICLRAFSHCDKNDHDRQSFQYNEILKGYEESEESKQRKKQQAHYLDSMIRSQIVDKKRIDSITKSHQVTPPEPQNNPAKTDTLGEAIRKLNEAIEKVDVSGGGGAP